jgi:hypothetical protein
VCNAKHLFFLNSYFSEIQALQIIERSSKNNEIDDLVLPFLMINSKVLMFEKL